MNTNQEHLPSIEEHTLRRKEVLKSSQEKIDSAFAAIVSRISDVQANMTNMAFETMAAQNPGVQANMTKIAHNPNYQAPTVAKPWINQEGVDTARTSIEQAYDITPAATSETAAHNSPSAVTSSDANDEVARLTELAKQIQRDNDGIGQELLL